MHPCPGNCVVIGRAVVYYARAVHAFSAEVKYRRARLSTGTGSKSSCEICLVFSYIFL